MPHIVVETTPRLAGSLDFETLFSAIHQRIAESGHAVLTDFKSRLLVVDRHLAGDDATAEFLVARLITTNPRPKPVQQAMAQVVHDTFRDAIKSKPRSYWWQCCVLIEPFEKQDYLKTDSHAPSDAGARGVD